MIKRITLKSIILILLIILMFFYPLETEVQAANLGEMEEQAAEFISKGKAGAGDINWQNTVSEFVSLGQILTMIGTGILIAVVAYMGIKYLTAGPEAQAKLKVQLIGIVISGVVLFGSYTIWKVIVNALDSI